MPRVSCGRRPIARPERPAGGTHSRFPVEPLMCASLSSALSAPWCRCVVRITASSSGCILISDGHVAVHADLVKAIQSEVCPSLIGVGHIRAENTFDGFKLFRVEESQKDGRHDCSPSVCDTDNSRLEKAYWDW